MKRISQFRFKHFAVWHHRSAMKVGVDGVLIGCWADVAGCRRILDVGTGCGVIALIMAQRAPGASVIGVDIDAPSAEEAAGNVASSPWPDRIKIIQGGFPQVFDGCPAERERFDLIVSNPPYFDSGVTDAVTPREIARHQGALSPLSILKDSRLLLTPGGSVAMVVPAEYCGRLEAEASSIGYLLEAKCLVRGHRDAPFKRVLLQWRWKPTDVSDNSLQETSLTLEESPGVPTAEYRALCRDFYLKF